MPDPLQIAEALRHAIATMTNDDASAGNAELRARWADRVVKMQAAEECIRGMVDKIQMLEVCNLELQSLDGLQQMAIERLKTERDDALEKLRARDALLAECADEIEADVEARYSTTKDAYAAERRRYERDMDLPRRVRAAPNPAPARPPNTAQP